jgi:hypothetical protein
MLLSEPAVILTIACINNISRKKFPIVFVGGIAGHDP